MKYHNTGAMWGQIKCPVRLKGMNLIHSFMKGWMFNLSPSPISLTIRGTGCRFWVKSDIYNGFMAQTHHVERMVNGLQKIVLRPKVDFWAVSVFQFPTVPCTPSSHTCCAFPSPAQQEPFSGFLLSVCPVLSLHGPLKMPPVQSEARTSPGAWQRWFRNCGQAGYFWKEPSFLGLLGCHIWLLIIIGTSRIIRHGKETKTKHRALSNLGSTNRRVTFYFIFVCFVLGAGFLVLALVCFEDKHRKKEENRGQKRWRHVCRPTRRTAVKLINIVPYSLWSVLFWKCGVNALAQCLHCSKRWSEPPEKSVFIRGLSGTVQKLAFYILLHP